MYTLNIANIYLKQSGQGCRKRSFNWYK